MSTLKDHGTFAIEPLHFGLNCFKAFVNWIELERDVTTQLIECNERKVRRIIRSGPKANIIVTFTTIRVNQLFLSLDLLLLLLFLPRVLINNIASSHKFQCPN